MVFVVDKLVATTVLHTRAVFPPAPLCAKNEAANKPRFSGNDAKSLYHKYSSPKKYLFCAEERESFLSSMKDNYVPTTRCTHLSQSSRQNRIITFGVGRWVVPLPPPHLAGTLAFQTPMTSLHFCPIPICRSRFLILISQNQIWYGPYPEKDIIIS